MSASLTTTAYEGESYSLLRPCSVCGAESWKTLFRPFHSPGPLVRCTRCGFVWVNPVENARALILEGPALGGRPASTLCSRNLDDIQDEWELANIAEEIRKLPVARANARGALDEVSRLRFGRRGRLLDLGSYCGTFLSVAQEDGWECTGVEPLVSQSIFARAHFGLNVVTDTLHETTFPPESFDVVTAFQVFEHLYDPAGVLRLVRGVLRPGGLALVEVPNIDTPWVTLLGKRHRHFVEDHVSFFSARTLSMLMEKEGFRVKRVYYPTRQISVHHTLWRYAPKLGKLLDRALPGEWLGRPLKVNLGDIVAVIGEAVA